MTPVGRGNDRQRRQTVLTDDDDACQRRRTTSANNNDVYQRWSQATVSITGHRDVVTLESLTYQASHQLSTSSMTVDNHFRFHNFELILFSNNLSTKCFEFATKMHIKLYFSNKKTLDGIRHSATRSRRKVAIATTRSERDDVQRRRGWCKPGDSYIGLKVPTGGAPPLFH